MYATRSFHRAYAIYHRQRKTTQRRNTSHLRGSKLPEWPKSVNPSPHDILGVKPGQPYSKDTFNQLAKVYHPDTQDTTPQTQRLPFEVRAERFRQLVEAHRVLSDPVARSRLESSDGNKTFHAQNVYSHTTAQRDQERGSDPMRQRPIYTSNGAFAILLAALSMLGAILQFRRLKTSRANSRRLEAILHEAIEEEIRAWASVLEGQSRDDRILAFLARRHGVPRQLQDWAVAHNGR